MDKSVELRKTAKNDADDLVRGIGANAALYLDIYGCLLTDKQAEILDFYINEDYSLSEIAKGLNISRQAAHDAVRNGTAALGEYEEKLGLVRAYNDELGRKEAAREIVAELRGVVSRIETIAERLAQILAE